MFMLYCPLPWDICLCVLIGWHIEHINVGHVKGIDANDVQNAILLATQIDSNLHLLFDRGDRHNQFDSIRTSIEQHIDSYNP